MNDLVRHIFIVGLVIAAVGLALWSGVGRSWFGQLPGDINVKGAGAVFGLGRDKSAVEVFDKERDGLHAKIGQLAVEVDFQRKKSKQLSL
jgi:hypothetical protein